MKNLEIESVLDLSMEKTWKLLTEVENYPYYIKFCNKAVLEGPFEEGSYWYDWTSVVYLPLKIRHKIEKVLPRQEIKYLITNPLLTIRQNVTCTEEQSKTKIRIEFKYDFANKLFEKIFGSLIYRRNKEMLVNLMGNYQKVIKNAAN